MESPTDRGKRDLIAWLRREIAGATGRSYSIDLEALGLQSLRALQALLRDLETEKAQAVRRAQLRP